MYIWKRKGSTSTRHAKSRCQVSGGTLCRWPEKQNTQRQTYRTGERVATIEWLEKNEKMGEQRKQRKGSYFGGHDKGTRYLGAVGESCGRRSRLIIWWRLSANTWRLALRDLANEIWRKIVNKHSSVVYLTTWHTDFVPDHFVNCNLNYIT